MGGLGDREDREGREDWEIGRLVDREGREDWEIGRTGR